MTYYVKYRMHDAAEEKGVCVAADNKREAYDMAVYEAVPLVEGRPPYSAWVSSVTYQNGNCRRFNTCEGLPY